MYLSKDSMGWMKKIWGVTKQGLTKPSTVREDTSRKRWQEPDHDGHRSLVGARRDTTWDWTRCRVTCPTHLVLLA